MWVCKPNLVKPNSAALREKKVFVIIIISTFIIRSFFRNDWTIIAFHTIIFNLDKQDSQKSSDNKSAYDYCHKNFIFPERSRIRLN